jgi:hypothetical protein
MTRKRKAVNRDNNLVKATMMRMSYDQHQLVGDAARVAGLTFAEFCRRCVIIGASGVLGIESIDEMILSANWTHLFPDVEGGS